MKEIRGGGSYQPLDAFLTSIASLGTAADRMIYTTGVDTAAEAVLTGAGRALLDDANAAAQRTTLELVSGGAGDIWVEKAGDDMTGGLGIGIAHTATSALKIGGAWSPANGGGAMEFIPALTVNYINASGIYAKPTSLSMINSSYKGFYSQLPTMTISGTARIYGFYYGGAGYSATKPVEEFGLYLSASIRGTTNYGIWTNGGLNRFGDQLLIDLGADKIGLIVQAHSTQNENLFVIEDDAGVDYFVVDNAGNVFLTGNQYLSFRDSAIGIYSQADTFLDLYADGAVRIGDSGAGAPTNYTQFADDGRITLAGTARYWIGFELDNTGFKEPSSQSATLVNRGLGTAYAYADGSAEHIHATKRITGRWEDTEVLEVVLVWESPATSKNCYWDVKYQLKALNEDMSDVASTSCAEHLKGSSATANGLVHSTFTIPTAAFDAGDKIISLQVYRLGAEVTDTLSAIAYLHKMIVRGIADNLGGVVT